MRAIRARGRSPDRLRLRTKPWPTLEFCTFYLDKLLFAVELKDLQEVIRSLRNGDIRSKWASTFGFRILLK